jgi:hypothetical protein
MKIKGNLLRVLFGINLLLFVFAMLSPWAWKIRFSIWRELYPSGGDELYWSFQAVFYPFRSGYQNRLISWDFWFGPYERILLWNFWFSQPMYYYGFTYDWIRIFAFQLLTVFSGTFALFRRWQKPTFMLVPTSFSILSMFMGLLLVARFMFVWYGYAGPAWGLAAAVVSAFGFLALFLFRHALERRKRQG